MEALLEVFDGKWWSGWATYAPVLFLASLSVGVIAGLVRTRRRHAISVMSIITLVAIALVWFFAYDESARSASLPAIKVFIWTPPAVWPGLVLGWLTGRLIMFGIDLAVVLSSMPVGHND